MDEKARQIEKEKWGEAIDSGFTAVPNRLLSMQSTLDLSSDHMIVIINLIRFWWKADKMPFPSIEKTSKETGLSEDRIRQIISDLEKREFLKVYKRDPENNVYDISLLKYKLSEANKRRDSVNIEIYGKLLISSKIDFEILMNKINELGKLHGLEINITLVNGYHDISRPEDMVRSVSFVGSNEGAEKSIELSKTIMFQVKNIINKLVTGKLDDYLSPF